MKPSPLPKNDEARLHALCRLNVLDTPPEERFDRITRICKTCFRFPIVLVSLVDQERQWFKSRQGLDATETPRDISFCGHAIVEDSVFSVPDAATDPRFADNPLVIGRPHVGSYFGAPLVTSDGYVLGTLCLIDTRPRTLSTAELATLIDLSAVAVAELERNALEKSSADYRSQTTRLETILSTVVEGIITIDEGGRIDAVNPAVSKIFGYSAAELHGINVKVLMPPRYAEEHDQYLRNYLNTGVAKIIGSGREVVGKRKDGSEFPLDLAISEMWLDGQRHFVGVLRDITERTKVELMKRDFISTVSHELRTPLTSIRGALNLVIGKSADCLPDKPRRMLEIAQRNSERLTLLINDVLDLEKIESGGLEFELAGLDLSQLARRALEDNEGFATKHTVTLKPLGSTNSAPVWGDGHRLLQVFANLLSNAIKFSPAGGAIETTLTERDDGFRVGIRDHGPGIPELFQARIFQRFAQADSSSTRQRGGSGLGLNIAKAIIEHHGGRIGYETEDSDGTLFYFDLPRWHEVIESDEDDRMALRALVCEDDPDAAEILSDMLRREGLLTDRTTTAEATRNLLADRDYALLLLDLTLPDADGLELLNELRQDHKTANLPVIVVSGRVAEGRNTFDTDSMLVVDWLQKPVDEKRLARAVQAVGAYGRPVRILHVEDDADVVDIVRALCEEGVELMHAATLGAARQALARNRFDLILLDLGLADGPGIDLLDELKGDCPVVIFSGQTPSREVSDRVATALTKSTTSNDQLVAAIKKALRR